MPGDQREGGRDIRQSMMRWRIFHPPAIVPLLSAIFFFFFFSARVSSYKHARNFTELCLAFTPCAWAVNGGIEQQKKKEILIALSFSPSLINRSSDQARLTGNMPATEKHWSAHVGCCKDNGVTMNDETEKRGQTKRTSHLSSDLCVCR